MLCDSIREVTPAGQQTENPPENPLHPPASGCCTTAASYNPENRKKLRMQNVKARSSTIYPFVPG